MADNLPDIEGRMGLLHEATPVVLYNVDGTPASLTGGGGTTNGLTDTQLRASAVSVTFTNASLNVGTITNPLPAGTNTLGSIANTAFGISGSLPAGTNTIGAISNTSFSISGSLPTGANTIGSIANTGFGITGSLPAGTNALGSVTVTGTSTVQGVTASATVDSGNPMKVGAVYNGSIPTFTSGQVGNLQMNIAGALNVAPMVQTTAADGISNANYGFLLRRDQNAGVALAVSPSYFNGTTWDRARGDTNGAWVTGRGGANIATNQIAVATTATLVAAARAGRQKITITPTSSTVFYIGGSTVSATTGLYVAAGASITLDTAAAIYAIGSAALTVSYIEYY